MRTVRPLPRALVALLVALVVVPTVASVATPARADERTAAYDANRNAWDSNEPALSPTDVASSDFGAKLDVTLDGPVYAQPLVRGGTVLAVTEKNTAYGIDRTTGAIQWQHTYGAPFQAASIGCSDLAPDIGITGTPVIDPSTGVAYFTSKVADGPDAQHPHWYVHAVDVTTGVEQPHFPVTVQGTYDNDPARSFDPFGSMQRPGLLLMGGVVYVGFASHCSISPYRGTVLGVNAGSGAITALWTTEAGTNSDGAGIWQAGSGLVSDAPGSIIVTTGNGLSGADGPDGQIPKTLSESVLRLHVGSDGKLSPVDWFSPSNAATLDANDQDLGSGGPVVLPDAFGTPSHPHLLTQVGKDGRFFLLDRDKLGGKNQLPGGGNAVVGTTGPYGGVWGHAAAWTASGGLVYYTENAGFLRVLQRGVDGAGNPVLSSVATSSAKYGYTSGSPVITSNGTDPSSGVVWEVYSANANGSGGELRAYAAIPSGGVLPLVWSAPIGTASKFTSVATDGGVVFLGTRDGHLKSFGRPTSSTVTTSPVTFGSIPVGTTTSTVAHLTAAGDTITVQSASASAPFAVTTTSLPRVVAKGTTIDLPVSFTPSTPGDASGLLTVVTTDGTIAVSLMGRGTTDGLHATPATLAFPQTATTSTRTQAVSLQNTGTTTLTIQSVTAPTTPYSAASLPTVGSTLTPGASVTVSVTYAPTAAGSTSSSLVVATSTGTASVPISGSAVVGTRHLTIAPTSLDFGNVPVGVPTTLSFVLGNSGNLPLTLSLSKQPLAPYSAPQPVDEGQPITPDDHITVPIVFTPTATGTFTGSCTFDGGDGAGQQKVIFTGVGVTPVSGLTPIATPGWSLNGGASVAGDGTLTLTRANQDDTAASAFSTAAVPSDGLTVQYVAQLGPGGGADGMTLTLQDASTGSASAVGSAGNSLGFAGLHGIAIALDTFQNGGEPSASFVGVAGPSAAGAQPAYVATNDSVLDLRAAPRLVQVTLTQGHVIVRIDGVPFLNTTGVAIPANVLVGLTAGTAGLADAHTATGLAVGRLASSTSTSPFASWALAGSTVTNGAELLLTQAGNKTTAGSGFRPGAVASEGLSVSFTARSNGGDGADGMALALIDPASTVRVGHTGGGEGFTGLTGTAVSLDSYQNPGDPGAPFIGLSGSTTADQDVLPYVATAPFPSLRTGTHAFVVTVAGGHVRVSADGTQVLDTVQSVPAQVLVGFTGGNGGLTDDHAVSNVVVTPAATDPWAGWTTAGSAVVTGAEALLTKAGSANTAGSIVRPGSVSTEGLSVSFTARMNGGSGAHGICLALLDPSSTKRVGGTGGGEGWAGLTGTAVSLDTYQNPGDPSASFVGVTGAAAAGATSLPYLATAGFPGLRTGTHAVVVTIAGGHVVVKVDGTQVLDTVASVPSLAVVGFTAGNGGVTDDHAVSSVVVTPTSTDPWAGWTRAGSAVLSGPEALLTAAGAANTAGSITRPGAVTSEGLSVSFTARMNGGSGAHGICLALLDPSSTKRVGGTGGGEGWAGLTGTAVSLDTYQNPGDPSASFVGVTGAAAAGATSLPYLATAGFPGLRTGLHRIVVHVAGGHVTVSIDGTLVLDAVRAVTAQTLIAFTAGNGGVTDDHAVSNVVVGGA